MNHLTRTALRTALAAITLSIVAMPSTIFAQGAQSGKDLNVSEVGLINIRSILSNWGFLGGNLSLNDSSPVYKLPPIARIQYGKIEGTTALDTPEEFITAAFFSPIQISPSAKATIDRELPPGPAGALKLGAMWMRKIAENPVLSANYQKAINMIIEKSNVSMTNITNYYNSAMEKEILDVGTKNFGSAYSKEQLRNTILRPLIAYYLSPTDSNLVKVSESVSKSGNNMMHLIGTIVDLSTVLSLRLGKIASSH